VKILLFWESQADYIW